MNSYNSMENSRSPRGNLTFREDSQQDLESNPNEMLTEHGIKGKIAAVGIGFGTARHSWHRSALKMQRAMSALPEPPPAKVPPRRPSPRKELVVTPLAPEPEPLPLPPPKPETKTCEIQTNPETRTCEI